jgi:hypothetical protein
MKTTSDKLVFLLATTLSVCVVSANGYLFFANQEHPQPYLMAIGLICFAWAMRHFVSRSAERNPPGSAARRDVTLSIVFACLLLSIGLIARLGWIGGDFRGRSVGFITGVFVVLLANVIPKQAGSACALAMRRVVGWALVLGGLGYTLAWLLLPLAYAADAALLTMAFAMTYAIARVFWFIRKNRSIPPTRAE